MDHATNVPDAELVRSAAAGDRSALAHLYRRHAGLVRAVLLARVPSADADDLTHEVFAVALTKISTLKDPSAVAPWLAALARRKAADLGRWWVRASRVVRLRARHTDEREPAKEDAERVLAVIRSLPDAYQETLVLRLVEGLTGPQIAASLGMTPGSVRVNLHRGMALLTERLVELGWDVPTPHTGGEP